MSPNTIKPLCLRIEPLNPPASGTQNAKTHDSWTSKDTESRQDLYEKYKIKGKL